jgi:hypothetical protein
MVLTLFHLVTVMRSHHSEDRSSADVVRRRRCRPYLSDVLLAITAPRARDLYQIVTYSEFR